MLPLTKREFVGATRLRAAPPTKLGIAAAVLAWLMEWGGGTSTALENSWSGGMEFTLHPGGRLVGGHTLMECTPYEHEPTIPEVGHHIMTCHHVMPWHHIVTYRHVMTCHHVKNCFASISTP